MTRVLFVGESWAGSCARSLKEALNRCKAVTLDEVNEDLFIPKPRARWLRAVNRVLAPAYRRELERQVLYRLERFKPEALVAYKGTHLSASFLARCNGLGCLTANIYPDYSPHAYGATHRHAVGAYDLVISTKPFHPALWQTTYGYANECRFVPQGYDPALHLAPVPPRAPRFDVVMVATWRREYGELLERLAGLLAGEGVTVGIGGNGWAPHRRNLPADWVFAGELQGRAYVDWLRQGRICLAPLTREVLIDGVRQPGDEDTTRTYELAAAHCFFIHRRTAFVQTLYDEQTEVPMFDSAEELARKILHYLPRPQERAEMATAAHRRAVPAYSLDSRAEAISNLLSAALAVRRPPPGPA
jgi:spore maturation protein CgeB